MNQGLDILAIALAVVAGGFVIATVLMYFCYHASARNNEVDESVDSGQVTEVKKYDKAESENQKNRNKYAKDEFKDCGIQETSKSINPNFVIERSLMFVSTDEVI